LIFIESALGAKVFIGVLAKPFHHWFGFSGAISTLAKQERKYIPGFQLELHLEIFFQSSGSDLLEVHYLAWRVDFPLFAGLVTL
jgi:hypothetical protein